ncbi:MAG: hypothetical protein KatS3mg129_3039 [Leptospiraceae bacterium]|nr:MAG: hypothetical protein KatS3mg129_3039 [Leptospiraceae bacterium]
MKELFDAVEKDKLAGVHKRSDGKLYYIQRKVNFQTIDFNPEYIFSQKWSIFQKPLKPIDWYLPLEELDKQLTEFSLECSYRFHYLWYKYIDIMLARSLSLNDKNLYIKKFIKSSIFLDLGIPENPEWTNVPAPIHNKIINEYEISKNYKTKFRIFYLSEYLTDLTEDINHFLSPYKELWEYENTKLEFYENINNFVKNLYKNEFFDFIKKNLNQYLIEIIKKEKISLENIILNNIYFKITQNDIFYDLSYFERKIILEYLFNHQMINNEYKYFFLLNEYTIFPQEIERFIRKILYLENQIHKEKIHQIKILYNRIKKENINISDKILEQIKNTEKENLLQQEKINLIFQLTEFLNLKHNLYLYYFITLYENKKIKNIFDFPIYFKDLKDIQENILKKQILDSIKQFSEINYKIIGFYKKSLSFTYREFIPNPKYINNNNFPKNLITGNPFHEKEILEYFKNLIKERLKPIRMASNDYSLLYNEKHGILTLNPVLKLWKHQIHFQKDLPEITQLELNTSITIECLLDLLQLVDKNLLKREIQRGNILKQIKGSENLLNMTILLIPGSCYPLKEIPSSHFPQYKNKIIGEKRFINEVGIKETHYILTGAWYNKKNHTLYYPIGGDNAELLKKIYLGIRVNTIPAFFFAIGQFVFDCLPDTILYYKTTKLTFREILLKIYKNQNYSEKELKKIRLFSKEEIKFQFAIYYSLLVMENLTGGLHIQTKIPELYKWFFENLDIQSIFLIDKENRKEIRIKAQNIIEQYNKKFLELIR